MNQTGCKSVFVTSALLIAFVTALLGAHAQNPQQAAPPSGAPTSATPKTASQQFKNMQILKDVPADQVIPRRDLLHVPSGQREASGHSRHLC